MTNYNSDIDGAKALVEKYEALRKETGKVIVGQDDIIHHTILSIFCQGHVLLVGVPGLAKTLLVNTIGAITEDETQWNINPEDAMLYRSERHDRFFQPRPEIDLSRLEKMMI